jgi:hypothetical protein
MKIYCLTDFKSAVDKLIKKKSYNTIEQQIIDYYFCGKTIDDVLSGARLNNSTTEPYIKKRLNGAGGFRFYYLVKIEENSVYLMFVHPKSGSEGSENITDESKAKIYKDLLNAIKTNNLLKVEEKKGKLYFTKL